jgi:cell division septation protein DedD
MTRDAALAVITLPTTRIKQWQREQDYQENSPQRQEPHDDLNRHWGMPPAFSNTIMLLTP